MRQSKVSTAIFLVYSILMLYLLFHRELPHEALPYTELMRRQLNLQPGQTIRLYLSLLDHPNSHFVRLALINLGGNVFLFIPLGYLLPAVFLRLQRIYYFVPITAAIISAVELLQLLTLLGSCDIDDLILNMIGCLLGFLIFSLVRRSPKKEAD